VEWTSLLAAMVGAAIGLVGDSVGRFGSRRQAREARTLAIEDAERLREQTIADERRRIADQRGREAAETILSSFRRNIVRLRAEELDRTSVTSIVLDILVECVHVPDADVRTRLLEIEHWLDIGNSLGAFGPYSVAELVFHARQEVFHLLGTWLRREGPVTEPTDGWRDVQSEAPAVMEAYQATLREEGVTARVPIEPPDY
jgi:hypothetical protein